METNFHSCRISIDEVIKVVTISFFAFAKKAMKTKHLKLQMAKSVSFEHHGSWDLSIFLFNSSKLLRTKAQEPLLNKADDGSERSRNRFCFNFSFIFG